MSEDRLLMDALCALRSKRYKELQQIAMRVSNTHEHLADAAIVKMSEAITAYQSVCDRISEGAA